MSTNNDNQLYTSARANANKYIKSLTETELRFIAKLDFGMESDKYFESLKLVIARVAEILVNSENWFPYEIIELGANHLVAGHEREFTGCLLIVIINVIHGNDSTKYLDEYMYDRSNIIIRLPDFEKTLIENLYFNQQNVDMTSKPIKDI